MTDALADSLTDQADDPSDAFFPACDANIAFTGRVLLRTRKQVLKVFGAEKVRRSSLTSPARRGSLKEGSKKKFSKSKYDACAQFDWPGVSIHVSFVHAAGASLLMDGGGNYFNIILDDRLVTVLKTDKGVRLYQVVLRDDLVERRKGSTDEPSLREDAAAVRAAAAAALPHRLTVEKRTEPHVAGLGTYNTVTFYGILLSGWRDAVHGTTVARPLVTVVASPINGAVERPALLPYEHEGTLKKRMIDFIGDSDTAAFGMEHSPTHIANIFSMKPSAENVGGGYAGVVARCLGARMHVCAWSGKGVALNAPMCGSKLMGDLIARVVASSEHPPLLALNNGGNGAPLDDDGASPASPSGNGSASARGNEWGWGRVPQQGGLWTPGVVVIMLGVNDFGNSSPPSIENFAKRYARLVRAVLDGYASDDLAVLCVHVSESGVTSTSQGDKSSVADLVYAGVKRAVELADDDRVHMVSINPVMRSVKETEAEEKQQQQRRASREPAVIHDWGAMRHWSVNGHLKVAEALLPAILRIKGWNCVAEMPAVGTPGTQPERRAP